MWAIGIVSMELFDAFIICSGNVRQQNPGMFGLWLVLEIN